MDHGRRAHLLGAREELRRARRLPPPRPAVAVLQPALPGADRACWLADPVSTAYGFAQAINAVLMVAAAVPVYFWARRLMSPRPGAACRSVLVLLMPSQIYSGMLMTENAFLLAFVSACFADRADARAADPAPPGARARRDRRRPASSACRVLVLLAVYVVALGLKLVLTCGAGRAARDPLRAARASPLPAFGGGRPAGAASSTSAIKARRALGLESGLGAYGGVRQGRVRPLERLVAGSSTISPS